MVLAHAFVVGGAASDSERSIVVGGVDSVAADTFDGRRLRRARAPARRPAAAHRVPATVLRYSGSPLRYSFSERAHTKSVTLVDLPPDGAVVGAARCRWPSPARWPS